MYCAHPFPTVYYAWFFFPPFLGWRVMFIFEVSSDEQVVSSDSENSRVYI